MVALGLFAIVLMALDHRQSHLVSVREALSVAVYPLRALVDLPFSAVRSLGAAIRERGQLLEENASLRRERLIDSANLQRLSALEAENERLRALMDSSAKVADRVLVGEIMSVDQDQNRHKIVLNKGLRDGAHLGQALLDAHGIVGQITQAGPLTAEAILISDPGHATPVEVARNGLRTIAVGTGQIGRLSVPFLQNNADIENGDVLISSGLGGSFPPGYPVGIVTSIQRDLGEPFAEVTAEPSAALDRIHEVLLVWSTAGLPSPLASEEEPDSRTIVEPPL